MCQTIQTLIYSQVFKHLLSSFPAETPQYFYNGDERLSYWMAPTIYGEDDSDFTSLTGQSTVSDQHGHLSEQQIYYIWSTGPTQQIDRILL